MRYSDVLLVAMILSVASGAIGDVALPDAKPVPIMQVLPLPHNQTSITRNGNVMARILQEDCHELNLIRIVLNEEDLRHLRASH